MAVLVIEQEGSAARYYKMESDRIRIGRDPSCDVVLASQFVSRMHADIVVTGEKCELIDLGSSNGTALNGRRVPANVRHELKDGDVFKIEDFQIQFVLDDATSKTIVRTRRAENELFVDTEAMEVYIGEKKLDLTQARVLKLLAYLYDNRGRVCSENELGNHVWASDQTVPEGVQMFDPGSLYQLIYLARRAIETVPRKPQYLINVQGLGYRLYERPQESN
ncbi:MAG TPA: FHA domain-containing protein [Dehalococcoidia bacterium]